MAIQTNYEIHDRQKRLLFANWFSLFGIAVMVVSVVAGFGIFLADDVFKVGIPYVGVAYVLLWISFAVGALIGFAGAVREARLRRVGPHAHASAFTLDLSQSKHLVGAVIGLSVAIVGIGVVASAGYSGVEYMSSNEFCSEGCHSVMVAEGTAHPHGSHAQVDCVACHVGEGAPSYIASKLAGLHRLRKVIFDDIRRPIPTPVEDMRPARETCENCHWKERFVGYKEKVYTHYESNAENTQHRLRLLINVGGKTSALGAGFGIHYHMQLKRKVEFVARDHQKQDIPWVRVTDEDGSVREFASTKKPLSTDERQQLRVYEMDCLDCHNRPAHQFQTPVMMMNNLLESGAVSAAIPSIKAQGLAVLSEDYTTTPEAKKSIDKTLRDYYASEHSEFAKDHAADLDKAIGAIVQTYNRNIFPEMKASWKTFVDNIGHRDYPGCFRCHNDDLKTSTGDTIFTTCNKCHVVLAQDEEAQKALFTDGVTFHHYGDDSDINSVTLCTDCHSGGKM